MPRRLPDDPKAAVEALSSDDLRNASRDLSSNDTNVAKAQNLALAIDPAIALNLPLDSELVSELARILDSNHARILAFKRMAALDSAFDGTLARALADTLEKSPDRVIKIALDRVFFRPSGKRGRSRPLAGAQLQKARQLAV